MHLRTHLNDSTCQCSWFLHDWNRLSKSNFGRCFVSSISSSALSTKYHKMKGAWIKYNFILYVYVCPSSYHLPLPRACLLWQTMQTLNFWPATPLTCIGVQRLPAEFRNCKFAGKMQFWRETRSWFE